MVTSTFGEIVIMIGGLVALGLLEGVVIYAVAHPTWQHLPPAPRSDQAIAGPGAPSAARGAAPGNPAAPAVPPVSAARTG